MGWEVWGTYSVRDHHQQHPWAADVILGDRLAIPVPPRRDTPAGELEWLRWEAEKWPPHTQQTLISILGDHAYPIPWNQRLKEDWKTHLHGGG